MNAKLLTTLSATATLILAAFRAATVTKIGSKDRWVSMKMDDGGMLDVQAGPEVKNFAQIKVGDHVSFAQDDTISVEVVPAGQAAPAVSSGSSMVTAPAGAKPMGIKVETITVSGAVTAIDYAKRLVTVKGPQG